MATYFPNQQLLDPLGSALGQGLGQGINQWYLNRLRNQDIQSLAGMGQTQDIYNTMYGARGMQAPQAQMPHLRSPMGQKMGMQGLMQNLFGDPLQKQYLKSRITATDALTKQREEAAKQALPDRMLRQADRYLRVVDDIMSEYWYTPEGPYRNKLLKDAQGARKKAVKLIKKYGPTSESGKASLQQLDNLDEEIERAGGKVSPIKSGNAGIKKFVVDKYPRPKTKVHFDNTLNHISNPAEKKRYFEKWWRKEFGAHK